MYLPSHSHQLMSTSWQESAIYFCVVEIIFVKFILFLSIIDVSNHMQNVFSLSRLEALKMHDLKTQDLKTMDHIAWHENAEPESDGLLTNLQSVKMHDIKIPDLKIEDLKITRFAFGTSMTTFLTQCLRYLLCNRIFLSCDGQFPDFLYHVLQLMSVTH